MQTKKHGRFIIRQESYAGREVAFFEFPVTRPGQLPMLAVMTQAIIYAESWKAEEPHLTVHVIFERPETAYNSGSREETVLTLD